MVRDTNADWEGISWEPYYGVFSHTEYFRENLTPERLSDFWEGGRSETVWKLELLRRHYGDFKPRSAIDFGCGVGRLAFAMAEHSERVYGIEIATGMREEALRNAPANFEICTTVDELQVDSVDWINSTIVFQHIHPANGIPILAKLLAKLAPGGAITLQFGFFKDRTAMGMGTEQMELVSWDGERVKSLVDRPFGAGAMMMYDYDFNQIFALLCQAGIGQFIAHHTNHGGAHGAFLIGRKTA